MTSIRRAPTFPNLNDDIMLTICEKAGPRTAARLSCASRDFDRVAAHPHLWQGFQTQHIGPVPAVPAAPAHDPTSVAAHRAFAQERHAFAQQVPAASCVQAAKACLGSLDAGDVFLVAFPNETDTPRWCIEALIRTAAEMDRPFRLLDAARVASNQNPADLGPQDFCVFQNVEAVSHLSVQPLYALLHATKLAPGRKIVLLHNDNMDTCDGGILDRVPHQLTYQAVPANFPIDPVAATL